MSKRIHKHGPFFVLLLILAGLIAVTALFTENGIISAGKLIRNTTNKVTAQVISPNGGEIFKQGSANTISWKGGFKLNGDAFMAIGLVQPDASTGYYVSDKIIGWINNRQSPGFFPAEGSTSWTATEVCNFTLTLDPPTGCKAVAPGKYKIIAWTENQDGSMYIASGQGSGGKYPKGTYRGNWDVSDQPFTIVAP